MTKLKTYYEDLKQRFLNDKSINPENRKLFKKFLEFQEKKGKRSNNLPVLDNGCYKTLIAYIGKFKNVNKWFKNKSWENLTKKEIEKVYEGLEEGRITTRNGDIFKDKSSYYNKIFKSEPFRMAGKKDELARDVIRYNHRHKTEVRFFNNYKEEIKKLAEAVIQPKHKLLIWLLADYMENVGTAVELVTKDFRREIDKETKEVEYYLTFRKEILKRSRTARTEINIFPETVEMLDLVLKDKQPEDKLFNFGVRQAEKIFNRAIKITGLKLVNSEKPQLKDIRSSGACYLLIKDEPWTTDEIRARLGHKESSIVLDKYITYLALDKKKAKKKIYQGNLKKMQEEIEKIKQDNAFKNKKIKEQEQKINILMQHWENYQDLLNNLAVGKGFSMPPEKVSMQKLRKGLNEYIKTS